jgi:hypothetical protein
VPAAETIMKIWIPKIYSKNTQNFFYPLGNFARSLFGRNLILLSIVINTNFSKRRPTIKNISRLFLTNPEEMPNDPNQAYSFCVVGHELSTICVIYILKSLHTGYFAAHP